MLRWLNAANVSAKLNEEADRQKALELAKNADTKDEITRRAVDLQKSSGLVARRPAGESATSGAGLVAGAGAQPASTRLEGTLGPMPLNTLKAPDRVAFTIALGGKLVQVRRRTGHTHRQRTKIMQRGNFDLTGLHRFENSRHETNACPVA